MVDLGGGPPKSKRPRLATTRADRPVLPGLPSTYFETNNRGVTSLTLNLKTAESREIPRNRSRRLTSSGKTSGPVRQRKTASATMTCGR